MRQILIVLEVSLTMCLTCDFALREFVRGLLVICMFLYKVLALSSLIKAYREQGLQAAAFLMAT